MPTKYTMTWLEGSHSKSMRIVTINQSELRHLPVKSNERTALSKTVNFLLDLLMNNTKLYLWNIINNNCMFLKLFVPFSFMLFITADLEKISP